MLGRLQSVINRLLPFATPGTPIVQDLAHLGVICATLYFAPQIQAAFRRATEQQIPNPVHNNTQSDHVRPDVGATEPPQIPINDRPRPPPPPQVEDDDTDDEDGQGHGRGEDDEQAQFENEIPLGAAGQAGPAQPNPAFTSQQQRPVGAKKAKSLARRDQRRAYHEFVRSQGEAQRSADAEGQHERVAAMNAERERRAAAEAEIAARDSRAREDKKNKEKQEREQEMARRSRTVELLRSELSRTGCVDLGAIAKQVGGTADLAWVGTLAKASGMLGQKDDREMVIITGNGFLVRVSKEQMQECYRAVLQQDSLQDDHGRISYGQVGDVLSGILREQGARA